MSKHRNYVPNSVKSLRLIQPPENDKTSCRLAEKISVLKITLTCHVIIYHSIEWLMFHILLPLTMSQSYFVLYKMTTLSLIFIKQIGAQVLIHLPQLTYCHIVYNFCLSKDSRKLEKLQERALKAVFNKKINATYEEMVNMHGQVKQATKPKVTGHCNTHVQSKA